MNDSSKARAIGVIAAQIEAAASLLRFAADDLAEIIQSNSTIFQNEFDLIIDNLRNTSIGIEGHGAFLLRSDLFELADTNSGQSDYDAPAPVNALQNRRHHRL
ncbi:MAG TPA: hypothetical protein PLQ11_03260 [Beijerinckiaceae bacterium]|nr:hypothetical protein [Beijerinckiaceae bacterium]